MKCPVCNSEIHRESRNNSQNNLFHLWMRVLADETGCDMEDVKRSVKRHILGVKETVCTITGEVGYEDYKTSEMSKKGMAEFLEKIQAWAKTDLNVDLPNPEDQRYEELIHHYQNR